MKTNIIYLIIISICVALLVSSCATGKDSIVLPQPATEKQMTVAAKQDDCYVEMNNGSIIKYSRLKLVTGVLATPYLLANGEIKISVSQIKAYRDANYYAIAQREFYTTNNSHVAKNVLPGFAVREIKGDVNLYSLQYFNGSNIYKKFFLQKGNDGKIMPYTPQLLNEYAQNNMEVKNFVTKKKAKQKNLIAVVENYNSSISFSIN